MTLVIRSDGQGYGDTPFLARTVGRWFCRRGWHPAPLLDLGIEGYGVDATCSRCGRIMPLYG